MFTEVYLDLGIIFKCIMKHGPLRCREIEVCVILLHMKPKQGVISPRYEKPRAAVEGRDVQDRFDLRYMEDKKSSSV